MRLWVGLIVCIVRGFSAQLELWRLLTQWGLGRFPRVDVTDMAIYKRLERTPPTAMRSLFGPITAALRQHGPEHTVVPDAAFATEIVAMDQTVLDPVRRTTKILRDVPVGDPAVLPGVLACRFEVRRQPFQHVAFSPEALQNEKPGAPALWKGVPPGSLVLFDLGSCSVPWFDGRALQGSGEVSRCRERIAYLVAHVR
jgi:hypothetical protein